MSECNNECNMRVNEIVDRVLEEEPKWVRALDLFMSGKTYREIARELYGDDSWSAVTRVARLLNFARKRLGLKAARIIDEEPQIVEDELTSHLFNSGGGVVIEKRKVKGYHRQLVEHEQLIYFILRSLGYGPGSELLAIARSYHYRLFPRAWARWGGNLRCWRNGSNKIPFSFTLHSLAYVTALVRSVLLEFGIFRLREMDEVVRQILPTNKRSMLIMFNIIYAEIGGWVLGSILHPQL